MFWCFFFIIARVENHKRKVLEQCDVEEEIRFEELMKKKVAQGQTVERIRTQLLVSLFPLFFVVDPSLYLQACCVISSKDCVSLSIRRKKNAS